MNNVALIFPLKFKKFYINPFYLQKIYSTIVEEKLSNISLQLLDMNDEKSKYKLNTEQFELAIIDTPEGSVDSLIDILTIINTNAVMLVGDIIKYGKSQDLLVYLNTIFKFSIYGCIDDASMVNFLKIYLTQGDMDDVSGLMYFKDNMYIQNKLLNKDDVNKKIQLHFTDNIIHLYENKGIQLFMDGLSRGCENNCSFCKMNNNMYFEKKIEPSNIDIIKTIEDLRKKCKKTLFIQFTDENFFGGGLSRLEQILELTNNLESINFNGLIGIDTRLDSIYNPKDSDELNKMRQKTWCTLYNCGLRYCFLGVETFSESQAFRYNKNLDLSNFEYTISFLEKKGINYTIGLILWDPLMKKQELMENLNFIKSNNLLGHTASLLKVMRIQVNSRYLKKYCELSPKGASDYFNINDEFVEYKDLEIKKVLPFVQKIYHLFADSGYRHSDVALFSVLYDESTPQIYTSIPYIISKMEYDILLYLLQLNDVSDYKRILNDIYACCQSVVLEINNRLKRIESEDVNLTSIKNYYDDIFSKIYDNLENDIKCLRI